MLKFLTLALVASAVLAAPSSKIESRLTVTLITKQSANVLVSMKEGTSSVLSQLKARSFSTRNERLVTVGHSLMAHAESTQKEVIAVLNKQKESVDYEVFWITNQVYIRNANAEIVNQLAALDSVKDITEEFEVTLDPIIQEVEKGRTGINAEWGLENIQAEEAWNLVGGNSGEGVIVASIDTGCHSTHKDLADNFVGLNYGWRDVTLFGTQVPRDDNGHGTHTIGSIVGHNGIGVAPEAKWMSCKALNGQGSGTNAGLISCGQFVACPTLPDGSNADCTKAPHVVSNSWGGGQANPFYNEVINAWHAANIIPVFANGNSGPDCSTANSPADSLAGVIAVGATDIDNGLASFSSKGPTAGGRQKPDISGPGYQIRSAWHTANDAYNTISGTSMATPHVAGVVALLKSFDAELTYEQVKDLLEENTFRDIVETGKNCGSVPENIFPNMAFGHGIVNALNSLSATISKK